MKKKFSILLLVMVLALGSLGVGYAAWTDVIYQPGVIEAIGFCQQIGKTPVAFVRSASMVRIARRMGATVAVGAMALGPSWRAL